ncbi:MAG: hypothetical protein JW741_01170 [Sedimentisphaerales bacterium]|nr:hypothetical protein [Sedimentisphaerales bacterium]
MNRVSMILLATAALAISNSANAGVPPTIHPESPTGSIADGNVIVLANVGDTIEFQFHAEDADGDLRLSEMYLTGAGFIGHYGYAPIPPPNYGEIGSKSLTFDEEGVFRFAVNALDHEGNYNSIGGSCGWMVYVGDTPADFVEDLAEAVEVLGLPKGTAGSLQAKLDAAKKKLEDDNENNDVAAVNALEAFINEVEAQRDKKIPGADADALIAIAQAIIDLLDE